MFNFDPSEPLFIVGDLNMNLLSDDGNDLTNSVRSPTRIQTNFFKKTNSYKTSKTLIDVVLHNHHNLVKQSIVIDCPFSDHCFVATSLDIAYVKQQLPAIMCRNLSEPVLAQILLDLEKMDLTVSPDRDIEINWTALRKKIMQVIDRHAPLKRKVLKHNDQFPWIDKELLVVQNIRGFYYFSFRKSNNLDESRNYNLV